MRLSRAVRFLALYAIPALASTPQFNPRQDINTNFQHLSGLAIGDFNGDGKLDIAVCDVLGKQIVVYLNNGSGSFSTPISTTLQISADGVGSIVVGDFNEDGKQDLIVGTVAGSQADIFLSGNGDGTFTQQQVLPGSFGFFSAAVVDINHDSHLDLIAGGNGALYLYLGDGHGNFTLQPFPNQGPSDIFFGIVAGDFNNDKNVDFLATAFNENSLRYFSGNGDGSFTAPSTLSSSDIFSPHFLASADFNGDGKLDLLVGSSNIASIVFGNRDGTFQLSAQQVFILPLPPAVSGPVVTAPPVVAAADMDGDGKVDAVTADSFSNSLNIFINDGTGKFPQASPDFTASLPAGSNQLQLADLNGDGLPDVIVTNYLTQTVSIFLSIRPPTAAPTVTLTSSATQQLIGAPLSLNTRVAGQVGLIATGAVTLLDGSTSLGQQSLDASGQAIFSVSNLATGQHALTVSYAGDKNYLPANSSSVNESVTDFQLALPSSSQTVSRGSAATYSLSVTPVAGFTGDVTFTCTGLPAGTSCVAASTTVSGQPTTTTLTVTTIVANEIRAGAGSAHIIETATLSLISFLLIGLFPRRSPALPRLAILLAAFVGVGLFAGCSGSQTSSSGSGGSTPMTTSFAIIGSTTQGAQTISHQVAATLTVN
jgi:hypothetical protein